jgi:hypothetical protein
VTLVCWGICSWTWCGSAGRGCRLWWEAGGSGSHNSSHSSHSSCMCLCCSTTIMMTRWAVSCPVVFPRRGYKGYKPVLFNKDWCMVPQSVQAATLQLMPATEGTQLAREGCSGPAYYLGCTNLMCSYSHNVHNAPQVSGPLLPATIQVVVGI